VEQKARWGVGTTPLVVQDREEERVAVGEKEEEGGAAAGSAPAHEEL
jgi:hypothetical protein